MKVLHVVENLDRGAVESWLVRMLAFAQASGIELDWTFYCTLGKPGALDIAARRAGAKILYSPAPLRDKCTFVLALRRALRDGRYDILHCHHDLVSGVYLAAAAGLPFFRRLVHVHNADESLPTSNRIKHFLYRRAMREISLQLADRVIGISNHTLDTFLAGRARRPGCDIVHYYGIDSTPFVRAQTLRAQLRRELGVLPSERIMLFAGRMVPEKNPLFAVEVLAALHRLDPSVTGIFVGAGSLDGAIRRRAAELKITRCFRALGWRSDIAVVMSACDLFILPRPERPMEGFGIAVVEAQLAGLPLLLSRGISDDALLPSAVFRRLPLSDSPETWARAAIELLEGQQPSAFRAQEALSESAMDMTKSLSALMALYA